MIARRILLVTRDDSLRAALDAHVGAKGFSLVHEPEHVRSPARALAVCPDAVLLDLNGAEGDLRDVVDRLRVLCPGGLVAFLPEAADPVTRAILGLQDLVPCPADPVDALALVFVLLEGGVSFTSARRIGHLLR